MKETDASITVVLPDMFVSFLAQKPNLNKYYETARMESEAWLTRLCMFNEKQYRRLTRTDFSYFCSIAVWEAGPVELRTVCDWGNWVFPFDDRFDNGDLKDDPGRARIEVDDLLAAMRYPDTYDASRQTCSPLVAAHNSVWFRIREKCSESVQRRFAKAMEEYCLGALQQVDVRSENILPDLETFLNTRRNSAGVTPLFALFEYAYGLDLPDDIFKHESLQQIRRIGTDLVLLQNDILSYCKEQAEGVSHNIIAIHRLAGGLSGQAAFDKVEKSLSDRYRDWYLAQAILPQCGEHINAQVQKYIRGVQDVVLANLNWSFRSERYFGKKSSEIRYTRTISVLPVQPVQPKLVPVEETKDHLQHDLPKKPKA